MDGLELLTQLRKHSAVPVVFLTSKDAEDDQLYGLSQGADDYITKPFSIRLLIERIRAILRRAEPVKNADSERMLLVRGPLVLDEDRHLCTWQGEALSLTVTEFLLLKALAQHPGHVKSRNQLMDAAYGDQIYVEDRTIDSPRQAHSQEVQGHRSGLLADRDALRCRLPIHIGVIRSSTI